MGNDRTLPESELDIMLVVWDNGGQASAPMILSQLQRPLTASALHSYLKRLEEKEFLTCTKQGKMNLYTALVSKEEYQHSAGTSLLRKLYNGSLSRFAVALYGGQKIQREELEQLQNLLDDLSREAEE